MRSSVTALVLVAIAAGGAWGQPSHAKKEQPKVMEVPGTALKQPALEVALATALKDNPDLKVAAAKLAEAEAQLHRARLQVVQKVVSQQRAIEQAQAAAKFAEAQFRRIKSLHDTGAVSKEAMAQAEQQLATAKANLANAQAEMSYLLGKPPGKSGAAVAQERLFADLLAQEHYARAFAVVVRA